MIRLQRVLGRLAVVIALVGCGGGSATSPDGGAGRGGTSGVGGQGGGAAGTTGAAGVSGLAGNSGTAGSSGAAGVGSAAGASGIAGVNGAAGLSGSAGSSGTAGLNGAAGQAAGGVGGMNCRPDILIVQDRSGSMNNDDNDQSCATGGCGANSKWSQVTMAITNVVGVNDGKVNWGIKYFPNNNACDASAAPSVAVGPVHGAAVAASIAAIAPGGTTPTRDAITYGMMYLQTLPDSNPKYLLLATDGLPNCPVGCASMTTANASCTMTDNPSEDQAAEMAVMTAASQGIKTFVVGIGNLSSAVNTLNQLALAGGEPQPGASTDYYAATDEAAFELALNRIVSTIAGCPP